MQERGLDIIGWLRSEGFKSPAGVDLQSVRWSERAKKAFFEQLE
jgi:hypothetical protein